MSQIASGNNTALAKKIPVRIMIYAGIALWVIQILSIVFKTGLTQLISGNAGAMPSSVGDYIIYFIPGIIGVILLSAGLSLGRNTEDQLVSSVKPFLSKNAMLVVLILVMLLFELLISGKGSGSLLSPASLTNLIRQNGYVVILATGMLLCILTGGNIDLSVGSVVALVGAFAGVFMVQWGLNPYLSIFLCLILSLCIGAWQAFWIAYVRIPPFVTTLAGMMVFRGIALLILKSQGISPFPASFKNLFNNYIPGTGNPDATRNVTIIIGVAICVLMVALQVFFRIRRQRKGYTADNLAGMIAKLVVICAVIMFVAVKLGAADGIPLTLVWLAAIVLIYTYFTQSTVPGRYLYALGGNAKAARLSGINTKKMMFFAYTNMGFLAGIAGLLMTARFNQASTTAGTGFELDAIGACFIGGASAYGGIGTVGGVVIGAIFMGVLNMGMSLLGLDQNLRSVIKGLVLLAAVVFDVMSKNRKQTA